MKSFNRPKKPKHWTKGRYSVHEDYVAFGYRKSKSRNVCSRFFDIKLKRYSKKFDYLRIWWDDIKRPVPH